MNNAARTNGEARSAKAAMRPARRGLKASTTKPIAIAGITSRACSRAIRCSASIAASGRARWTSSSPRNSSGAPRPEMQTTVSAAVTAVGAHGGTGCGLHLSSVPAR